MESSSVSKTGDFFYGWDLLYKTIQSEVNKKSDLPIALVHFLLTKHYNFRCVGVGDDKTLPEEEGSELLPDSWNDDDTKYSLRYVHDKQLYLLLGHITEDALLVNMMDITTKKVSNICLTPETLVVALKGSINTLMPTASEIVDRFRKELLDPVFTGNSREVTTQTTTTTNTTTPGADPLRIGEPRRGGSYQPYGYDPRPFGFPDIGRGDLDPLGRGGPGNLFTFPSHPNMGPGPAPRFDPFTPLNPNAGRGPNPDHMRPPNWDSDYFM